MPLIPKQEPPYYTKTNGDGYGIYEAIITQSGTAPPIPLILQNTTGLTPTWYYDGVGASSIGEFPETPNITVFATSADVAARIVTAYNDESGFVSIKNKDAAGGGIDNYKMQIRITIYP